MTPHSEMSTGGVIPPIRERYDLKEITTFIPNKKLPIHNWFYFKEGFSADFARLALAWMNGTQGLVLDPFMGVGTTPLVAKEQGLRSIGIDVSPLMVLVSKVKCRDYDVERLKAAADRVFAVKFSKPDLGGIPKYIRPYFSKYTLEDVIFFRRLVNGMDEVETREFLLVGLISATARASFAYRDGSLLRIVKKAVPPFRKFYRARIRKMIKDIEKSKLRGPEPLLHLGDARLLKEVQDDSVDSIITSPPYLNKIEYTKVYGLEYALFLPGAEPDEIRSYIGSDIGRDTSQYSNLPPVAGAYFKDIQAVLGQMRRVLKDGGKATILVAGGVFPNMIVNSDVVLASIAYELGFRVDAIIALNKRVATRDRVEKIGWARESAVIIQK